PQRSVDPDVQTRWKTGARDVERALAGRRPRGSRGVDAWSRDFLCRCRRRRCRRREGSTRAPMRRCDLGSSFQSSARYASLLLGLASVYFGAAKLGFTMAVVAEQVTIVWPPTGIALAAVLQLGYRVWPAIWLGAFLANVTANEPVVAAGGVAIGN